MTTIHNLRELADMVSAEGDTDEELISNIKRNAYKYTDCGMWSNPTHDGVTIGSIVEGYDGDGTSTFRFDYPFEEADYRAAEAAIEKEAAAIWDWCNKIRYGCVKCSWGAAEDEVADDAVHVDDEMTGDVYTTCPECGERAFGKTDAEWGLDFPDVWAEHVNLPGFSSPW